MKQTKPGASDRSFAAYPRCSADLLEVARRRTRASVTATRRWHTHRCLGRLAQAPCIRLKLQLAEEAAAHQRESAAHEKSRQLGPPGCRLWRCVRLMSPRYSARRVPGRIPSFGRPAGRMRRVAANASLVHRGDRSLPRSERRRRRPSPSRHSSGCARLGVALPSCRQRVCGRRCLGRLTTHRQSDEAAEQGDEADEAGASDGASQLIPGVRRTVGVDDGDRQCSAAQVAAVSDATCSSGSCRATAGVFLASLGAHGLELFWRLGSRGSACLDDHEAVTWAVRHARCRSRLESGRRHFSACVWPSASRLQYDQPLDGVSCIGERAGT